jgi:hypothetical protein
VGPKPWEACRWLEGRRETSGRLFLNFFPASPFRGRSVNSFLVSFSASPSPLLPDLSVNSPFIKFLSVTPFWSVHQFLPGDWLIQHTFLES